MSNTKFSYLTFINFSFLSLWDYKRYASNAIISNHNIVKLSSCITEENEKIKPFEFPNEKFEILGVNNKTGLFDAYIEKGSKINQPYKIVKDGFLAYNPYRINVGSIGLKTKEQKYKYISPAYVVFSCKKNLIPEFLYILFKTNKFNKLIRENTTGSVRQTLSFASMGNIMFPLPSLEKQQEIINKYNEKIKLAEKQEQQAKQLEDDVEKYLQNELGLKIVDSYFEKNIIWSIYKLSQLSRWDVYNNTSSISSQKYKISKFKDIVVGKPMYGANEKAIKIKTDVRYIRITDINEDGSLNNNIVSAKKVDTKYLLKENDFLIARSGTVGRTFLYKNILGKCIYAGYLIKFNLDTSKVKPEYILYYSKSKAYKTWILSNQRANAQPNINSKEYLESPMIIPPLDIQNKIVEHIKSMQDKIKSLNKQAENNRTLAQQEFERELFA
ncbi:restriction endonuclease subunit S [Helicobacter sp. 16-1353]|uniref:restriction endonuclease subunit S n=1 Tax=Helicobacter sp. 16-1353 TaxID=2004996 RepID=UPI0015EFAD96|nr:restriction endonuclease subunit S [Helicobacter sp. 16-1353]